MATHPVSEMDIGPFWLILATVCDSGNRQLGTRVSAVNNEKNQPKFIEKIMRRPRL